MGGDWIELTPGRFLNLSSVVAVECFDTPDDQRVMMDGTSRHFSPAGRPCAFVWCNGATREWDGDALVLWDDDARLLAARFDEAKR